MPAPVFLLIAILLGIGLNRYWPLQVEGMVFQSAASWAFNLVATFLLAWCFALFLKHRTTIFPGLPVKTLVGSGPYRFTRNPMYLSLALFHLGIAFGTGIVWHLLTFLPTLAAIHLWVIAPEEAYLRERFGETYQAYCRRVPRWI